MARDPYRYSAALFDYVSGPLNITLKPVRQKLAPPIQGMQVLDVGCGTGSDLELYHQGGCKVHGVDLSTSMLKVARRKFGESAELWLADAAHIPYQNESFDLVLCTHTLHEIPPEHRSSVVREMIRVVKNNGRLLITDFDSGPYSFPMGWINYTVIFILEIIAGREHFNNGQDFIKRGGLKGLIEPFQLKIEGSIVFSGGNVVFLLLSKD